MKRGRLKEKGTATKYVGIWMVILRSFLLHIETRWNLKSVSHIDMSQDFI